MKGEKTTSLKEKRRKTASLQEEGLSLLKKRQHILQQSFHPSFSEAVFQCSDLAAKRSFSKAIFQQSDLSAKRSFSEAIFQRSGLAAKRSFSKAVFQQSDLTSTNH